MFTLKFTALQHKTTQQRKYLHNYDTSAYKNNIEKYSVRLIKQTTQYIIIDRYILFEQF